MRITWLAAADARGHLMRAHLMRGLLAAAGVRVDIVTTSLEGQAFLAALGTPSSRLAGHYGVAFDRHQNMCRARTEECVVRYFTSPARGAADWRRFRELAADADLVVNDFHPLLLAGPSHWLTERVVHVYGEHLWDAIAHNFAHRGPGFIDEGFSRAMRRLRDRGHARVEHTLDAPLEGRCDHARRHHRLLPMVALPRRSPALVRSQLGLAPHGKLAAVYLNPHFTDSRLADALERALDAEGFAMHAVAEGFAGRPRWRAYDPDFADVVAASDLSISAPGMAALGHARMLGIPFLALSTDQPEQSANLRYLADTKLHSPPHAALDVSGGAGVDAIRRSVARIGHERGASDARSFDTIRATHRLWVEVFVELCATSTERRRSPRPSRIPLSIPMVP